MINPVFLIHNFTCFDAYDFRARYFIKAESYFDARCGNKKFERVISNVLPVIRGEEEDFTGGCVMFYSPLRFRLQQIQKGNRKIKLPNWDFSLLEKVNFPGLFGDFYFYRYKE